MASTSNAAGSSNNPRSWKHHEENEQKQRSSFARMVCLWVETGAAVTVDKKWCGLFMWVDKVLEYAMPCDDRTRHSVDDEEWKMKIAWKFGKLEAEIRVLKMGEILMFVFMQLIVIGVLVLKLDRQQGQLYLAKNK
ncbi:hypothetical protein Ahy_A05g022377 [Arachis hypogaea]|uniref:Uncharacterized protein n=1 Tax=Arachis hypogaea TaxID=3818 RepID=A0A445D0H3_ARAHY|nr:hypothetical protein Ahy_A05g022377 [Arachis hypogaea]